MKQEDIKKNSLRKLINNLPNYLSIYEDTFVRIGKKAKFKDSEYNVDFWARADSNKPPICLERYKANRIKRVRTSKEVLDNKLTEIYNGTITIDYSTFKSINDIAIFIIDGGKVKYLVSDALRGWLKGERGKNIKWKTLVKARDKVCAISGLNTNLHAHHIYCKNTYPDMQYDINNGIALEKTIHLNFHKRYGYKNNTKAQLLEYAMSLGIDLSTKIAY